MTQQISSSSISSRENARQHDGKFGTQARAEADLELDDTQAPASGSIAVIAEITEMPGFENATAHADGSITTKTIHGYDLALKQDERGWMAQPVVNDTGIDWGRAYARDRYRGSTPQQALRLTARDMHMRAEVTKRLHRELGFMKTTENTAPEIYSAITMEPEYEDSRTTIVTMDDPVRPGKSTELTAQHFYDPENGIQRGMAKGQVRLTEENCVELTGARYGQLWDAMHGAATYTDASVYGDGTSRLSRYNDVSRKLVDEAEEAGYTAFTSRRVDLSDDAQQYSTPTVRFSSETAHHFASVEIAGDTGEVQRYFQSRPVDEFPATARKFRQMEKFAFERTEQAVEINRLSVTGLTQ